MGQGCLQMQRSSLAVRKHTDSDCRWQGMAANCWQCMLQHTDCSRKQRQLCLLMRKFASLAQVVKDGNGQHTAQLGLQTRPSMLIVSLAAQPSQGQACLACHLLHSCAVQTRPRILVLSPAAPRTCSGPRPASWRCRRPAAGCRHVAASAAPNRCCGIPAGSAPLRRQGCGRTVSSLQSAQTVSLGQHAGRPKVTDSNGALTFFCSKGDTRCPGPGTHPLQSAAHAIPSHAHPAPSTGASAWVLLC